MPCSCSSPAAPKTSVGCSCVSEAPCTADTCCNADKCIEKAATKDLRCSTCKQKDSSNASKRSSLAKRSSIQKSCSTVDETCPMQKLSSIPNLPSCERIDEECGGPCNKSKQEEDCSAPCNKTKKEEDCSAPCHKKKDDDCTAPCHKPKKEDDCNAPCNKNKKEDDCSAPCNKNKKEDDCSAPCNAKNTQEDECGAPCNAKKSTSAKPSKSCLKCTISAIEESPSEEVVKCTVCGNEGQEDDADICVGCKTLVKPCPSFPPAPPDVTKYKNMRPLDKKNEDVQAFVRSISDGCPLEMSPGCHCRYPPAFKQLQCTGKIAGNCNCDPANNKK